MSLTYPGDYSKPAPTTRRAAVHYPAYYLGRPAARYLAVYRSHRALGPGLPVVVRAGRREANS
jgi:hypothetical protein